jgi:hypothetical protein
MAAMMPPAMMAKSVMSMAGDRNAASGHRQDGSSC